MGVADLGSQILLAKIDLVTKILVHISNYYIF